MNVLEREHRDLTRMNGISRLFAIFLIKSCSKETEHLKMTEIEWEMTEIGWEMTRVKREI